MAILSRLQYMSALISVLMQLLAFISIAVSSSALAGNVRSPGPPPTTCPQADGAWTAQEKFVWTRLCLGKLADFNSEPGFGGKLDPKAPEGLPESRVLRPEFLRAILLDERYRRALGPRGVRISGARFKETIDLEDAAIVHELWIDDGVIEKGVNFEGLVSTASVTFDGSKISGPLNLQDTRIGRNFFMRNSELADEVVFANSSVAGNLDLGGTRSSGTLWLDGVRIGGHVLLNEKAQFNAVHMAGAQLKAQLNLRGSQITGLLDLEATQVDGYVLVDSANLNEVMLNNARLGGLMELSGSALGGPFNMKSARVAGPVLMDSVSASASVSLIGTAVAGDLDLRHSNIKDMLWLDEVRVDGNLLLSDQAEFAAASLAGAQVKGQLALQKSKITGSLDMDGIRIDGNAFMHEGATFNNVRLSYAHLGGLLDVSDATFAGEFDMSNANVEGTLLLSRSTIGGLLGLARVQTGGDAVMNKAKLASANMIGARLKGNLDLGGATATGPLSLKDVQADGYCFMDENSSFNEVILTNSKLAGLYLSLSKVKRLSVDGMEIGRDFIAQSAELTDVNLSNAHVVGYVDLRHSKVFRNLEGTGLAVDTSILLGNGADFAGDVNFPFSKVKGDLDLTGGTFRGNLDLTSTRIERRFALRGDETLASGSLENLNVSNLEWGTKPLLVLQTFLGKSYVPELYERLAKSYADVGKPDVARSIFIAKQNAEYDHTDSTWWRALLFLWWSLTAYGYRPEIGLLWIAGMVVIGAIVFKSGEAQVVANEWPRNWFFFSLDSAIPVINLDKKHEEVRFLGWQQYFLYFLRFLGAILVVLVIDFLKQAITGPK